MTVQILNLLSKIYMMIDDTNPYLGPTTVLPLVYQQLEVGNGKIPFYLTVEMMRRTDHAFSRGEKAPYARTSFITMCKIPFYL